MYICIHILSSELSIAKRMSWSNCSKSSKDSFIAIDGSKFGAEQTSENLNLLFFIGLSGLGKVFDNTRLFRA